MAPVLKKGLFCCLSLRTCALILGAVTLVGNVLTLSMFAVSMNMWLDIQANQSAIDVGLLHPEVHPEVHTGVHPELHSKTPPGTTPETLPEEVHYYDGFEDSEAMEELLEMSPRLVMALVWFDLVLVVLETLAVILLIWGAATRKANWLLPWLAVELVTTLYDLGFFAYLFLSNDVVISIDLMPIILLPITVYCWLVVYSLYQECKETATRNTSMPLSMSALEAGAAGGNSTCTVPYGRMAA